MIKSNILTLNIKDLFNESSISVELDKETIYRLYRIKEIYNYKSLTEYDAYTTYCDKIKDNTQAFINEIYNEYIIASEKNQKQAKTEKEAVLKTMDELINAGYDFKEATQHIKEKYDIL